MKSKYLFVTLVWLVVTISAGSVSAADVYLECRTSNGKDWGMLRVNVESKVVNVDSPFTRMNFENMQLMKQGMAEAQGKQYSSRRYDPEQDNKNYPISEVSENLIVAADFFQFEKLVINRVTLRVRVFSADKFADELNCRRLEKKM